jgi:hypothetical protein
LRHVAAQLAAGIAATDADEAATIIAGGTISASRSNEGRPPPLCSGVTRISRGTDGLQTRRWREMDSNFRFRAFLSLRSSSVFSIPRSRSAEGTDAESGTEAISLKRKESGGLPIAVGCTRSKTGRVPCLHICWAEQCEPDILLYRSPYKCFPLEKTGCNPS